MQFLAIAFVAAIIFGICWAVDKTFTKLFRSKAQHLSGLAVRANKRYGIFGVVFSILGIMGTISGPADPVLFYAGIIVLLIGIGLTVHYLSFGIFYNGESMLVSRLGKKDREYQFSQIQQQKLYVITGGSTVIELHMDDGSAVSLQSTMDGVYPFMDAAFAGWCMQTGHDMQECDFYAPSKSWWFPHEEDV